jgi:hypothetical protein
LGVRGVFEPQMEQMDADCRVVGEGRSRWVGAVWGLTRKGEGLVGRGREWRGEEVGYVLGVRGLFEPQMEQMDADCGVVGEGWSRWVGTVWGLTRRGEGLVGG